MTFDTAYYNDYLFRLRAQSELSACLDGLLDAIDLFQSAAITFAAVEAERTGSPVAAMEALGDYIERGKGSVLTGIGNVIKWIWNMGKWTLKTVKNMTVFAIRGFKGTVGGALKEIDKMGDRVEQMQDRRISSCCHMDTIIRLLEVFREHIFVPSFNVPEGKIAQARLYYVQQFNSRMKADAQVDKFFKLQNPPGGGISNIALRHFRTLADVGGTNAKRLRAGGEALLTAEKVLKERLDDVKQRCEESRKICEKIAQKQKYKDKYVKDAGTTRVLTAAFVTAILANDLKYLAAVENLYVKMIHSLRGKSKSYATDDGVVNPI